MNKAWFILGREPLISTAEICAVLDMPNYQMLGPSILAVSNKKVEPDLINRLGGTIKIGEEQATDLTEEQLLDFITNELKNITSKIHFGLSVYAYKPLEEIRKWGLSIKKALKEEGLSVRYVENREPILSSVTVEKNGLTKRGKEFLISQKDNTFSVAITQAVQPFEEWSKRDFGRPDRDDTSGMLPPKLATILINLSQAKKDDTLLDPFCGSGTILTEALHLGFQKLFGSDISKKAIEDTKKNITWAEQNISINNSASVEVFELDSAQLSQEVAMQSVDTIVSEPYMGKPLRGKETKQDLEKQTVELKKIYLEAFQQFYKILKPQGKIIFIIPRFKCKNDWVRINCVEEIKKIGFKTLPLLPEHEFLLYSRTGQFVGREIWRFQKI